MTTPQDDDACADGKHAFRPTGRCRCGASRWLALEVVDEHTVGIRIQPKDIRYELIGLMMSPNFAPEVVSFGPAVSRPVHLSINKVVNRRGTSPHLTNESLYTLSREQLDQLVELGSLRVGRIIFQLLEASRD